MAVVHSDGEAAFVEQAVVPVPQLGHRHEDPRRRVGLGMRA